jgi:hypothetical protein
MKFLVALQAVNACNKISVHAQEAQDGLLRTICYAQDLKLAAKSDLAYDEMDAIERDICNLYVRLGIIRSEAANGAILADEEKASMPRASRFEASNE